jgi:hypothetical protein
MEAPMEEWLADLLFLAFVAGLVSVVLFGNGW